MKLKSIVVGDIVKVSSKEAYEKVCEYLGTEVNENDNKFEVKYLDYDEEDIKTTWYALIQCGKKIEETKCVSLRKHVLEVIQPTETLPLYDNEFEEMLSFNLTGKKILKRLQNKNIRGLEKNYFSTIIVNGEYMVTSIPVEKMRFFDDCMTYDVDRRKKYCQKIKPIKIIQDILGEKLSQEEVDDLLACINKDINADFEIVSGKDITKYYNEKNYVDTSGTLGNSCMKYTKLGLSGVFYMYEDYAEMVILRDTKNDKIYGRAILWTLHGAEEVEGKKFLDRIYVNNDALVGKFKQFAIENGFYYLDRQAYGQSKMMYDNKSIDMNDVGEIYVLTNPRVNAYMYTPYIDTFYMQFKEHLDRLYPAYRYIDDLTRVCEYHCTYGRKDVCSEGRILGFKEQNGVDD